jgi:hypothetical protein
LIFDKAIRCARLYSTAYAIEVFRKNEYITTKLGTWQSTIYIIQFENVDEGLTSFDGNGRPVLT